MGIYATILVGLIELTFCRAAEYYCDTSINSEEDFSGLIQGCIDLASDWDTVILPVGVYSLRSGLTLSRPVTLTTDPAQRRPPCDLADGASCAILRAAPDFYSSSGLVHISAGASGVWIDHVVIDGNRGERLQSVSAQEVRLI
jgi:hypothetical protein